MHGLGRSCFFPKSGRPIKTGRIKICSRWCSAAIEDKAKQKLMIDLCKICFLKTRNYSHHMLFCILPINPVNTVPGPYSTNSVMPSANMCCTFCVQQTGAVSWLRRLSFFSLGLVWGDLFIWKDHLTNTVVVYRFSIPYSIKFSPNSSPYILADVDVIDFYNAFLLNNNHYPFNFSKISSFSSTIGSTSTSRRKI